MQKTVEPIEMPFDGLTHVDPRNHVLDGVKIGRIHSQPRGATSWRCSLLSNYFGDLLNVLKAKNGQTLSRI